MSEQRSRVAREDVRRATRRRRRWRIALIVAGLLVLILGLFAWKIISSAFSVKDSMTAAMAQSEPIVAAVADGKLADAEKRLQAVEDDLAVADSAVNDWAWAAIEWVPVVGDNLRALRVSIDAAQWVAVDVAKPTIPLLDALRPENGSFDVDAIRQLSLTLSGVAPELERRQVEVGGAAKGELVGPVADGVGKLNALFSEAVPMISGSLGLLEILPETLGGTEPRDYLLMFQGSSEARSLGGNPAVLLKVRAEQGAITISGFANSSEFHSRAKPVMELDPEAVAIYGDKIGRWFPDITMTPDFPYSVELVRAFWDDTVGTPIDGVLSVDPTLLSYLLKATGPITLSTGDILSTDNAVPLLLNEVYFRYEDPDAQNAFFAEAAAGVFNALTSGAGSPLGLVAALQQGADEGRLLYAPTDAAEADLISGSRATGAMPDDNSDETVVGVYVNDNTGSKKSYYLNMSIDLSSTACAADSDGATYSGSATLTSILDPETAATLPYYITGPYFGARVISTYLVIYGPVGSTAGEVLIDDVPAEILSQGIHLGRPAVKVEVLNDGLSRHKVDFTFTSTDPGAGPIEVWHTPMTRETPVTIDDGCF